MWQSIIFCLGLATVLLPIRFSLLYAATSPQTGVGACYSNRLIGHRVSSGARYDPKAMTAAHARIPLGTHIKVTNLDNGKSAVVLVNDRLSAHAGGGIIVDLSRHACQELGFGRGGEAKVRLEEAASGAN